MNYCAFNKNCSIFASAGWQEKFPISEIPYSTILTKRVSKRQKFFYYRIKFGTNEAVFEFTSSEIDKKAIDSVANIIDKLIPTFEDEIERIKVNETQRTKRLKHNLITHNTMILQEIFNLIPQDVIADKISNQLQYVSSVISANSRSVGQALIRILKNASLSKAEFDVHEVLYRSDVPALEFDTHRMHKLLKLAFSSFWLDFLEKKITIQLNESFLNVRIDYKTISAVLCHLLDNATKYTLNNTDLHIHISLEGNYVVTEFDMISLRIDDDEVGIIFQEHYSGRYAKRLGLEGQGIGMYIVNKFIRLNNGRIELQRNCVPRNARTIEDIIYEQNRFKLFLPKA
jgi:signal transduction histidine kinase